MKEIGGYIELEHFHGEMLHENAIKLNCGRNALAYLIEARGIRKIALPYFMCDSVTDLCKRKQVDLRFYHIDLHFMPEKLELLPEEWLYLTDFYGQLSEETIQTICQDYGRVIVDYAQSYFKYPPKGFDALYTCRKFFGVADGAILYTDAKLQRELPEDASMDRMRFLLGRFERTASEFYGEYVDNNAIFDDAPLMKMSRLTENLLRAVDYDWVRQRRTANYDYLANRLGQHNLLELRPVEGAFAYPLLLKQGAAVKKKLIAQKIYVPTLWPNVLDEVPEDDLEYTLANDLLPLPCDQRYDEADMEYLCRLVEEAMA